MRLLQHPGMGQYGAMGSPMPMPMSSVSQHPNMYQGQGLLPPTPQNHSLSPSPGMLQPPPVVSPRPHSTGKPGWTSASARVVVFAALPLTGSEHAESEKECY